MPSDSLPRRFSSFRNARPSRPEPTVRPRHLDALHCGASCVGGTWRAIRAGRCSRQRNTSRTRDDCPQCLPATDHLPLRRPDGGGGDCTALATMPCTVRAPPNINLPRPSPLSSPVQRSWPVSNAQLELCALGQALVCTGSVASQHPPPRQPQHPSTIPRPLPLRSHTPTTTSPLCNLQRPSSPLSCATPDPGLRAVTQSPEHCASVCFIWPSPQAVLEHCASLFPLSKHSGMNFKNDTSHWPVGQEHINR